MKRFLMAVAFVIAMGPVAMAAYGDKTPGTIASEVTTKPTGGDGKRHSDDSEWTVVTAPDKCIIDRDVTKVKILSAAGSEKRCDVEYDDFIEVAPGAKAPRTIRVRTHARGPKGHFAGRGWCKARVEYQVVQYKE